MTIHPITSSGCRRETAVSCSFAQPAVLRPQPRLRSAGQAMAELLLGLVALIVIMAGIITFGEGGYHWLTSMVEAAANAWDPAINSPPGQMTAGSTERFVRMWDASSDQIPYTLDDQRVGDDIYGPSFQSSALDFLSKPVDYPRCTASFFQDNPTRNITAGTTTTQGWLMGQGQQRWALGRIDRQNGRPPIDFGSAFQALLYGKDSITIQSEVYLPPLSNLQ